MVRAIIYELIRVNGVLSTTTNYDICNLMQIVELIVNYYIDSDCKLYLDKEKLKKQEYSQVRVDNNSNHIENKTEAIFNVYTLFDLLKDIFKSLSIQKEDNKNVFMKILVLLDNF